MENERFELLTRAERDVLDAALGRTNEQIAHLLAISPNTVAVHLLAARRKLGSPSKGDAARAFQAWKNANQKLTRPSLVMVDKPAIGKELPAGRERVEEAKTPFQFLEVPEPASLPETAHARSRFLEDLTLALLVVTLVLASIRYLPDLAQRAQQAANIIDPINLSRPE